MRVYILILYWLPTFLRAAWRMDRGRYFVFRTESNDFLKWCLYMRGPGPVGDSLDEFFEQAAEEVTARQRRGEWV